MSNFNLSVYLLVVLFALQACTTGSQDPFSVRGTIPFDGELVYEN